MPLRFGGVPAVLAVPLVVLAVLAGVVLLPMILPLVAVQMALERRRLRAAAFHTACGTCGQVLGPGSLAAADAAWAAATEAAHEPGLRLRVVRHCFALCTACGTEHGWDPRARRLEPLPPDRLSSPRPSAMVNGCGP